MELKKSLDFRRIVMIIYFGALAIYLLVGLMPAKAVTPEIVTEIEIPSVGISSDVTMMKLSNNSFNTPDDIVGAFTKYQNKTFLVGHSVGVFAKLKDVKIGDEIIYDLVKYTVKNIETKAKSEIYMNELLLPEESDTIVLMTCAGELLKGGDATDRLIITAEAE